MTLKKSSGGKNPTQLGGRRVAADENVSRAGLMIAHWPERKSE
jgi:hypothetical protein